MIQYFKPRSSQSHSGFTLIEVLVIVIIIGILSAIAAPGWLSFINNRRLSSMRGQVTGLLRKAQADAKETRTMQAVLFDTSATGRRSPRMAVIRCATETATVITSEACVLPTPIPESAWQTLGNGDVKPGVVQYTSTTIAQIKAGSADRIQLVFDANGLVKTSLSGAMPFRVGFALTKPGSANQLSGEPRCVVVQTLIGGISEGNSNKADECGPI